MIRCNPANEYFSSTYGEARQRFLAASEGRHASIETVRHPVEGPDGDQLYLDAAHIGPANAEMLLVVLSGTHGPEGYCGSACQLRWLQESMSGPADGVSVLLVHAHNPYGFAWGVRHTHERVDLNRNFVDHESAPKNDIADEFFAQLGDAHSMEVDAYIDRFLNLKQSFQQRVGTSELAKWLGYGQYRDEQGLHFGGFRATWSRTALTNLLRRFGASASEVILIDIHTGLGRYGYGEILSLDSVTSESYARSHAIFGGTVHSMADGRSSASYSAGNVSGAIAEILPHATVTAHALEFGTFEGPELERLRLRYQHCLVTGAIEGNGASALREEYRHLFYPRHSDWMELVLSRSDMVIRHALEWLEGSATGTNRRSPHNFDQRKE